MTDDLLEDLLNLQEDNLFLEEENKKLLPLEEEINLIESESIRNFVRAILFKAETFWISPSGNVEGFHPPDEMRRCRTTWQ